MTLRTVSVHKEHIRLFNTIFIETASLCNRSCIFCPVHRGDRPDEVMSWNLINKMIAELHDLRYSGRMYPYVYNEPLRDSRLRDICKLFSEEVPRASIVISTNGDYIRSKDDIESLFDSGVRQLIINVYSATDGNSDAAKVAHGIRNAKRRYKMLKKYVTDLKLDQDSSPHLKAPKGARRCRVMQKFGVTSDGGGFGGKYELQGRSGNIDWWYKPPEEPLNKMCTRPFRILNMNWTGQAILCCNDYHGVTDFGNVADHSLVEIWNNPEFHRYRLFLQNKRRDLTLCDKCDFNGGPFPHMIDHVTFGSRRDKKELS